MNTSGGNERSSISINSPKVPKSLNPQNPLGRNCNNNEERSQAIKPTMSYGTLQEHRQERHLIRHKCPLRMM